MKNEKKLQEKIDTFVERIAIILIMFASFIIMLIICK